MASANEDPASEFETDEDGEFVADTLFPYAPPQQWVVLCDGCDETTLAVYTFVMAHLNPYTGKFDAWFGRKRIAQRFNRSLDWVDKRLKILVELGAITKFATWWVDTRDHSKGRSRKPVAPDGTKREQAPNRYRVHLAPPGGAAYSGPIKIAEFYDKGLILKRVKAARKAAEDDAEPGDTPGTETPGEGGAASQRPPSDQPNVDNSHEDPGLGEPADQQEQTKPQVKGGPPASGRGGRQPAAGGAAVQRPERPRDGKTAGEKTTGTTAGGVPPAPPVPEASADADASGPNSQTQVPYVEPTELQYVLNPLRARARADAGEAAVRAIVANPNIALDQLVKLIGESDPQLTQGQCVGRASTLKAFESRAAEEARRQPEAQPA